jgi:PhnB protein
LPGAKRFLPVWKRLASGFFQIQDTRHAFFFPAFLPTEIPMAVAPIPPGYASVTPDLLVRDARKAIDFYQRAFGAVELFRLEGPDGTIGHAEIKIGNSPVMLAEGMDGYPDPLKLGGAAVSFMIYVPDVDAAFARAVAAGATVKRPVADQFYGDRTGTLADPFGHVWSLGTHVEDVAPEEMDRRFQALMKPAAGA